MSSTQYEVINLTINDLGRISLPAFQRKFVWTKAKKESFVTTLHEGLPFGAVLVYPESETTGSKLLILDGQQRLSTIREYQQNRLRFWKPLNRESYENLLARINEHLPEASKIQERDFDELVEDEHNKLDDFLDDIDSKNDRKAVRALVRQLKDEMDAFVDLDGLQIPAIKFLGSRGRIADVFTNLNQGGVPLSKYEIFSASWIHTEIQLLSASQSPLQDQILSYVKMYYAKMQQETEFDLDGFSEDELTQNRVITLSELGIALGMYIRDHLKALVPQTETAVAEIGFGVLGIATSTDNRSLSVLIDKIDLIKSDLQIILERVERICSNLEDVFSKLLKRFKSSKNDEYVLGLSTTFKTLSYFAALWDLNPNDAEYTTSLKNIKSYYVFDALTKIWSSHGDQRLLDFYNISGKRNYLERVDRRQFIEAFDRWLSDTTPGIQFSKETTAIVTIHANLTYLSHAVPYGESFELEHIIARKTINKYDHQDRRRVFGNSIGNCMYLPQLDNNKKKEKTLYEVNGDGKYTTLMRDSAYFTEDEIASIIEALEDGDFDRANATIQKRAHVVGRIVIDALLD